MLETSPLVARLADGTWEANIVMWNECFISCGNTRDEAIHNAYKVAQTALLARTK
jgi:hypothetical protein